MIEGWKGYHTEPVRLPFPVEEVEDGRDATVWLDLDAESWVL